MEGQKQRYITVDVVVTKEGEQYSSWCPDLDIASCGDTPDEAVDKLGDAIELYSNSLEEEEREQVFRERGVRIITGDEPVFSHTFVTQYRQRIAV